MLVVFLKDCIFSLLLALALSACAMHSRYDSDQTNPSYYQGGSRVFFPYLGTSLKGLISSNNEGHGPAANVGSGSYRVNAKPVAEEEAALGILLSGISLLVNKDYYQSSYLSGHCVCRSETAEFDIPCSNVLVALLDENGKELSRILSEDGEFVFPVEKDKTYRLGIVSRKYILSKSVAPHLRMGDNVVLHLGVSSPAPVSPAE